MQAVNGKDQKGKIMYDRRKDMTKKAWKEEQKKRRVTNGFNTGTRTIKSNKDYNRKWKVEDYE